jgi:serine/threonine protein kinase
MVLDGRLADPAAVRRFRDEAGTVARLDHPHVVPVYEVGEHRGTRRTGSFPCGNPLSRSGSAGWTSSSRTSRGSATATSGGSTAGAWT